MFSFNKVFASVFLAVLCASSVSAVPYPANSKFATHRTREISRDFKLETYHPESSYEVRLCALFLAPQPLTLFYH